jgi:hypothetical protein
MMERILPPTVISYRILKKMDTQFQTPIKQRQMTPSNPMMHTRTYSKKKFCK